MDRKADRCSTETDARSGPRDRFRHGLKRLLSLHGGPREIARGFAAGIFVGMSPFMICHSVMAICLATILRGNRISAVAAVFITNPISAPLVYGWTYRVGKAWLGIASPSTLEFDFSLEYLLALLQCAPKIIWILTVGGMVAGLPLAILSYYLCCIIVRRHRRRSESLARRSIGKPVNRPCDQRPV
ncbi:MAG: DUF2062 domain-containing protein [Thermodesulfobacteriota bacterium]